MAVYWIIVVPAIQRGIAGTFLSGAWEAWITDEQGVDGIGRVFLRGTQWSYLGAIVGAILGVGVATQDLGLVLVFGGVVSLATGIASVFLMPEHGFVLLLTPAIALFAKALRRGGREPELEEAEAPA